MKLKSYRMIQLLLLLLEPVENPHPSNRLIIAEAEIELDLEFNNSNKRQVERILKHAAENLLKEYPTRKDLVYVVDTEEGSLVGKIRLYGFLAFNFIVGYGAFRDGLAKMTQDGITIADHLIYHSKHGIINKNTILTFESKAGFLDRLNNILKRIDYLKSNVNNLSNSQTQEELDKLYRDLANIIELLGKQEKQNIIFSLPDDIRNNLPKSDRPGVAYFNDLYVLKPENAKLQRRRH